jgi:hypothetical protein
MYIIQIQCANKEWQDKSVIQLFNPAHRNKVEQQIKEEMRSYGSIAVRCEIETPDKPISYLSAH